jgi:hypothetical protein
MCKNCKIHEHKCSAEHPLTGGGTKFHCAVVGAEAAVLGVSVGVGAHAVADVGLVPWARAAALLADGAVHALGLAVAAELAVNEDVAALQKQRMDVHIVQ